MSQSSEFDVLFEPVPIGPVTARNRFFQVPHCTGLGHANPKAEAALRGVKAEGGWAVVCTQEVEIHPSSEISPYLEGRLWDDKDIPAHAAMTDAVHEHGSLAGIELAHNGLHATNLYSRVPPMGPSDRPVDLYHPVQARAMNLNDIKSFKQWHVDAAKRSRTAGYDIVYVYAGHNMSTLQHFLLTRFNDRSDAYGGSIENRMRLLKETLSDVRDAVGGDCAVALRLAVDELLGDQGLQAQDEGAEIVSKLADIPDLWDVNVSGWDNDSATARFEEEGYQEPYTAFVKKLVNKPVVGVGRFTSPSAMVSQVKRGVLDFIGAARPSIADPFLPNKIRDGELSSIRECIGCNICVSCDNIIAPIRCTQNPTMGEEWKRNWHPERSDQTDKPEQTLVIGAGPAGLECALQLSRHGYPVMLAEATREVGGRLLGESSLPGLSSYRRVRDYRQQQLQVAPNVELLLDNSLSSQDVLDTGIRRVFIATGSRWCTSGLGRQHPRGLKFSDKCMPVFTPESLYGDTAVDGHVLVYDDDHYYLGGVVAEELVRRGCSVTLVTPANCVSVWTENTLEQHKIQSRLIKLGVSIVTSQEISLVDKEHVELACVYSGNNKKLIADALMLVTSRVPDNGLYNELTEHQKSFDTLSLVGDALAPSTVAAAVYSGHLAARGLHTDEDSNLFIREMALIGN